jgi:hypothetical protein
MPRNPHPLRHLVRGGVAGAAAVLLLTACGGSGDGDPEPTGAAAESTADAETPADGGSTAAAGADDFCSQAAGIDERVDSALADMDDGDPSLPDAFAQIATELRSITAPDAITTEWAAMAAGLDRMADAFADLDLTDLGALESLDRAEGDLTEASNDVDTYLQEECGL